MNESRILSPHSLIDQPEGRRSFFHPVRNNAFRAVPTATAILWPTTCCMWCGCWSAAAQAGQMLQCYVQDCWRHPSRLRCDPSSGTQKLRSPSCLYAPVHIFLLLRLQISLGELFKFSLEFAFSYWPDICRSRIHNKSSLLSAMLNHFADNISACITNNKCLFFMTGWQFL